jgi:hypothetical protein
MAVWTRKIKLNEAIELNNDEFDLTRVEEPMPPLAAERLAVECERVPELSRFGDGIRGAKSIAAVNRILSRVFDAADENRVWCGGF